MASGARRLSALANDDIIRANPGAGMASDRFTRREIVAAAPLVLVAPTLLRAQRAPDKVWRFLVIGDWGRDGREDQRRTALAMEHVAAEKHTEFVVSTGDNFYHWGVWSATDHRWNTCFENVYSADLGCWYSVLGNHDYGGSVEAQIERHEHNKRWNMDARWYDRVWCRDGWPSLQLLFFDTVALEGKEHFPFMLYGASMDRSMMDWQIEQMKAKLDPRADIRIGVGHHPIYSVGPHGGPKQYEELDKMLRDARVKVWVNGHDHCLYHVEQGGMHYVCSGAGSEVLHSTKFGPGSCALASECNGRASDPVKRSLFHKNPGGTDHIEGGFALFELGRDSGSFTFYNSDSEPRALGDGAVRLY